MAMPIKRTPVLRGREAREFEQRMRADEKRPVPREDYSRAQKVYCKLKAKSDTWL